MRSLTGLDIHLLWLNALQAAGGDRLKYFWIILAIVLSCMPAPRLAIAQERVDIELVLAVDASGSVNPREFQLQLSGIANAFRDDSIQQAIVSGSHRRIAASLLVWSDAAFNVYSTKWYILSDAASADRFAEVVESYQKRSGGGTGIGNGLAYAVRSIAANGIEGTRRIVDVSGDGPETTPWFRKGIVLPQARALAQRDGIMVNGLAILNDFPELDTWYRENVKSGPGSFVMRAANYEDFAVAIREKLWREITVIVSDNGSAVSSKFALK
ncbi:MAG: DUF1194 domain-containing protein [Rhizobiales bacterium]|nr:DUF1194 domain-containing protein [Hyphomicrobiales bacterium]